VRKGFGGGDPTKYPFDTILLVVPSLLPMLLLIKVTLLRQWVSCGGSANQRFAEEYC